MMRMCDGKEVVDARRVLEASDAESFRGGPRFLRTKNTFPT
jgi:hypothetical protein